METKCGDWERLDFPDFYVENNVWGKGDLEGYRQCLFRNPETDGSFGWEWDWPQGAADIAAFPSVGFGWKPWAGQSTTPALPVQVRQIKNASAVQNLTVKAAGAYNLTYDLWLTGSPTPRGDNVTASVLIWLRQQGMAPPGEPSATTTIGGEVYDLYLGRFPHATWPYRIFVKKTQWVPGMTDLAKFLDFLVKGGHVSPKDYLACIEFGNEVKWGSGKTELRKFQVDIKKH
jgi:serralysin